MSHHTATFTWPVSWPSTVIVTGTFDAWSGNTHHLTKRSEGEGFEGTVEIPYGEKVSFKYVVDGTWMIREDEAKEWDSAGNMNNVYTAPPAPAPVAAPEPTPAPVEEEKTHVPAVVAAVVPGMTNGHKEEEKKEVVEEKKVEEVGKGVEGLNLGAPIGTTTTPAMTSVTETKPLDLTNTVSTPLSNTKITDAAAAAASTEPAEPIKALAEAPAEPITGESVLAAITGLGAAAGAAALVAVGAAAQAVTGVNPIQPDPLTLKEAKAAGLPTGTPGLTSAVTSSIGDDKTIATSSIEPLKAQPAPVVTSAVGEAKTLATTAIAPLEKVEKSLPATPAAAINGFKSAATSTKPTSSSKVDVFSSNAPVDTPKTLHDLPAQHETKDANHKTVPMPVITNVGAPTKDRTLPSNADKVTKPISTDPAISAKAEKDAASATNGEIEGLPSRSYVKKSPKMTEGLALPPSPAPGLPLSSTTVPTSTTTTADPAPVVVAPAAAAAVAPSTPVSKSSKRASFFGGGSPASSAMSTPAKHGKEASAGSENMRKRKSSFFAKIKSTFGKDKEPK